MSRRERFDSRALAEVLGPRRPVSLSREERIRLLGEAAEALLEGRLPEPAARLFLAGGLAAWLAQGGDLLRDFWRLATPQGSHSTPAAIWARHRDEGKAGEETLASSGEAGDVRDDDDDAPRQADRPLP